MQNLFLKYVFLSCFTILFLTGCASLPKEGSHPEVTSNFLNERQLGSLSVNQLTDAPLVIKKMAYLDATPEEVWAFISDSEGLPEWIMMVKDVDVDHSRSVNGFSEGVGTRRTCSVMGKKVVEEVVYYDAPDHYGFQLDFEATEMKMKMTESLFLFSIEETPDGKSLFTWRLYAENMSGMRKFMFDKMVIPKSVKNLVKRFGGKLVKVL